jgi:AraC-like DNA-binding protein
MHRIRVDAKVYPLKKTDRVPDRAGITAIRGGELYIIQGPFGSIFFQKIIAGGIEIWQGYYQLTHACTVRFLYRRSYTGIHAAIKGRQVYRVNGGAEIAFGPDECNLVLLPSISVEQCIDQPGEYLSLDIFYPYGMLCRYLERHSLLGQLSSQYEAQIPCMLGRQALSVSEEIGGVIRQLVQSTVIDIMQAEIFALKSEELLIRLLGNHLLWIQGHTQLQNAQQQKMADVKQYIESNYSEHFSIEQLARQFFMNATSLKNGFKELYGMGPFTYLQSIRMSIARDLLAKKTIPVGEIADACGYKNVSSFIKVFKRHYGVTPGKTKKIAK